MLLILLILKIEICLLKKICSKCTAYYKYTRKFKKFIMIFLNILKKPKFFLYIKFLSETFLVLKIENSLKTISSQLISY